MRIGYDLDGIFIDKPPFVPTGLISWLYCGPQNNGPVYRIPQKPEQLLRKLTHYYLFRPPIKNNIKFLQGLANQTSHRRFYLRKKHSRNYKLVFM